MTANQFYLLTPPRIDPDFPDLFAKVLDAGRPAAAQIRLKDYSAAELDILAPPLIEAAQARAIAAIMNDRPDLAVKYGADGVHIGQEDTPYKAARAALGRDRTVGVTCHDSRHLAMKAGEAGADYVAFGAFFDTATKAPKAKASLEILEWWSALFEIPCVAIGGITLERAPDVLAAGADFIAVSSGVWSHGDGPVEAARAFGRLCS